MIENKLLLAIQAMHYPNNFVIRATWNNVIFDVDHRLDYFFYSIGYSGSFLF